MDTTEIPRIYTNLRLAIYDGHGFVELVPDLVQHGVTYQLGPLRVVGTDFGELQVSRGHTGRRELSGLHVFISEADMMCVPNTTVTIDQRLVSPFLREIEENGGVVYTHNLYDRTTAAITTKPIPNGHPPQLKTRSITLCEGRGP